MPKPKLESIWTRAFALLCLAEFLGYAQHFVLQPTFPLYITHLGGSPFLVGLVIASFGVTSVISRPIIGYWADRWSVTGVMILGLLTQTLSNLICFIPLAGATMIANGFRGIGWSGMNTGGYTLLATARAGGPARRSIRLLRRRAIDRDDFVSGRRFVDHRGSARRFQRGVFRRHEPGSYGCGSSLYAVARSSAPPASERAGAKRILVARDHQHIRPPYLIGRDPPFHAASFAALPFQFRRALRPSNSTSAISVGTTSPSASPARSHVRCSAGSRIKSAAAARSSSPLAWKPLLC